MISWQRETHTHSCNRSMTFLMCSRHKKGFDSNFKERVKMQKYVSQMSEWSTPSPHPPSLKGSKNSLSEDFSTLEMKMNACRGKKGLEATEQIKEQNTIRTQMQFKIWMENASVGPKWVQMCFVFRLQGDKQLRSISEMCWSDTDFSSTSEISQLWRGNQTPTRGCF